MTRSDRAAASDDHDRRRIVIVGAGGFGREVFQYLRDTLASDRRYVIEGFLDDHAPDLKPLGLSGRVLGATRDYEPCDDQRFLVAVGKPELRMELAERLARRGARFLRLVHPLAYVSDSARIGEGCIVAPFATVGAHATIGAHSVLTFYASAGHDAVVGRWCVFSPHSVANGRTTIGDAVFLGAHAVVNPLQVVGERARIAAGAVVYRSVPACTLAAGNPARPRPIW